MYTPLSISVSSFVSLRSKAGLASFEGFKAGSLKWLGAVGHKSRNLGRTYVPIIKNVSAGAHRGPKLAFKKPINKVRRIITVI